MLRLEPDVTRHSCGAQRRAFLASVVLAMRSPRAPLAHEQAHARAAPPRAAAARLEQRHRRDTGWHLVEASGKQARGIQAFLSGLANEDGDGAERKRQKAAASPKELQVPRRFDQRGGGSVQRRAALSRVARCAPRTSDGDPTVDRMTTYQMWAPCLVFFRLVCAGMDIAGYNH